MLVRQFAAQDGEFGFDCQPVVRGRQQVSTMRVVALRLGAAGPHGTDAEIFDPSSVQIDDLEPGLRPADVCFLRIARRVLRVAIASHHPEQAPLAAQNLAAIQAAGNASSAQERKAASARSRRSCSARICPFSPTYWLIISSRLATQPWMLQRCPRWMVR